MLSEFSVNGRRFVGFLRLLLDGEYWFSLLARYDEAKGRWEHLGGSGVVAPSEAENVKVIEERWKYPFVEAYWPGWDFDVLAVARETHQEKIPDNGSVG